MINLKKPKFWDKKKPNIYAYLLYPFSLILKIFNLSKNLSGDKRLKIKTICIGNIYIGGTGKTSLCIKLNQILNKKNIKSCFVKKYYKNHSDEQKLLEKYGKLFISPKRKEAIKKASNENYEIAIVDDGLQDKSVNYDLSFVCFNNLNWIGNGMTIPSGPLRESISNLKNYDHVFLNGNLENLDYLKKEVLKYSSKINIHVGKYVPLNINEFKKEFKYLVFSGIGNHQTFVSMIKNAGLSVLRDIEFPDHYQYNDNDINKILSQADSLNCRIITTEKDYFRLETKNLDNIKFLKSEIQIIDEEKLIKFIV